MRETWTANTAKEATANAAVALPFVMWDQMLRPRQRTVVRALTIREGGLCPSAAAEVNSQPPAVMTMAPAAPRTEPKMTLRARLPKPFPLTGISGMGNSGKPVSVLASADVAAAAGWSLLRHLWGLLRQVNGVLGDDALTLPFAKA